MADTERNIAEELLGKPAPEPTEKAVQPQQGQEATPQAPGAEPPPAPKPEPPRADPGFVPISAMLDEREKRQKTEAKLRELEAQQRQPEPVPSIQDPEQLAAYIEARAERAAWDAKANWSEHSARDKHGAELVDKALEWAFAKGEAEKHSFGFSPFALEQVRAVHPVDWVVKAYKQHQAFSEYGDDESKQKAFIEKRARELGLIPDPAQAATPAAPQPAPNSQPAKPVPSRSLASAPSAGGTQTIPTGPGVAFDSVFNR
jgi:hypothetical protein